MFNLFFFSEGGFGGLFHDPDEFMLVCVPLQMIRVDNVDTQCGLGSWQPDNPSNSPLSETRTTHGQKVV